MPLDSQLPHADFFTQVILRALEDESAALAELDREYLSQMPAGHVASSTQIEAAAAIAGMAALIVGSSWGNLTPIFFWGERLRRLQVPEQEEVSRLLFLSGYLCHHSVERAADDKERAANYAASLTQLLRVRASGLPANMVVLATEPLLDLLAQAGESAAFEDIVTIAEHAFAHADARLTSKHLFWRGNNLRVLDMPIQAAKSFESAEQIGRQTQWYWIRLQLVRAALRPAIEGRDTPRIDTLLELNRQLLQPDRPADWGDYHHLRGWDALLRGDGRTALLHYRQCIENYRAASLPPHQMGVMQGGEAAALILLGRADEAVPVFESVAAMDNERGRNVKTANVAFACAVHAHQTQLPGYLNHLQIGFAAAAAFDLIQIFRALPKQMAALCADALQHNIEAEFVRKMIAARKFAAPLEAGESWPWPLKVRTLGPFSIAIQGATLESGGKAQNKPLDLIRLLASNDGQPLSVTSVVTAMWPESESDAGRKVFDATLARLKKLIGSDDWISVDGGKLQLDGSSVWIDAMELRKLANRIDALTLSALSEAELQQFARNLLGLYSAPFLIQEPETSWLLEARERNKNRFVRIVERLGGEFERRGHLDEAIRLFDRGTEIEPVSEIFYRRLMLAHEKRGDAAEAMRVYRRCKEMLSILLSIAPSRETRAIVERLYQAES